MSIFDYYPTITYNNSTSVNILAEAEVLRQYLTDLNRFFKYQIKEGERPDILAQRVYGDPTLDWVIFLANGIADPYKDWPLDYNQFVTYIEDKYNTAAEKLSSSTLATSIAYYYYKGLASDTQETINSYNYKMTPYTYTKLGSPAGWEAKTYWEYELELNEAKREINILRPAYVSDFVQQFKDLFSNG